MWLQLIYLERAMEQTKRRRQSADAWRAVLGRFAESGLTVRAFCQREAIGIASFYQWRAKLSDSGNGSKSRQPADSAMRTAGFVDLGTLSASASRFELRLDLGGGVLLHLARG
jgi:putative transposase